MNLLTIIIILSLVLFTVLGLAIGFFKGFTKVKSWAVEMLLAGLIAMPIARGLAVKASGGGFGITAIVVTVVIICILLFSFMVLRLFFNKKIELAKKLSYYKQYDEREDNTEKILCAMGAEDKKAFKKLAGRKFKQSAGWWGLANRIVGAVICSITGIVVVGIISALLLVVLDFSRLAAEGGSLFSLLGGIYTHGSWLFFKKIILDFFVIGIVSLCIRSGYSGGITSSAWSFAVIGMFIGAGVLSFALAFNAPEFVSVAQFVESRLSTLFAGITNTLIALKIPPLTVARIIVGFVVFLFMLIAVILITIFVPKLIDKARDSKIFCCVDGVFGAIVLTVSILIILLVVGAFAYNLSNFEFMNVFNAYFEKSGIATFMYDKNLLHSFGMIKEIPFIGKFFTE